MLRSVCNIASIVVCRNPLRDVRAPLRGRRRLLRVVARRVRRPQPCDDEPRVPGQRQRARDLARRQELRGRVQQARTKHHRLCVPRRVRRQRFLRHRPVQRPARVQRAHVRDGARVQRDRRRDRGPRVPGYRRARGPRALERTRGVRRNRAQAARAVPAVLGVRRRRRDARGVRGPRRAGLRPGVRARVQPAALRGRRGLRLHAPPVLVVRRAPRHPPVPVSRPRALPPHRRRVHRRDPACPLFRLPRQVRHAWGRASRVRRVR